MNSNKIQSKIYVSQNLGVGLNSKKKPVKSYANNGVSGTEVSFNGLAGDISKTGWRYFRNLSSWMKDASEVTNAFIAAIGTGIIAPSIILVSPGKGDQEDKNKKFFQALRQPLSAGLQLLFQVPMTIFLTRGIDKLAYKHNYFKDDVIGSLIPDRKFLKRNITKKEYENIASRFEDTSSGQSLRQELEEQIRQEYKEVGIDISDEKLAKEVEKGKRKFLEEKLANIKHDNLIETKIEELKTKTFDIKDTDLITDKYRELAIEKNKVAYKEIEKNARLSWFDKLANITVGYDTKKMKHLKELQKQFTTEKGLELLKEDSKELFEEGRARLKRFIENKDIAAQKTFGNKKFWFSLFINLFMITASCYALNWAHPRAKEYIDKCLHKNKASEQSDSKKVEVK